MNHPLFENLPEFTGELSEDKTTRYYQLLSIVKSKIGWFIKKYPSIKPDLDDIISEASLRLWQLEITAIRNPEAWIHGLLKNLVVDSFRQSTKFKPLDDEPFSPEFFQIPTEGLSDLDTEIINLRAAGYSMTEIGQRLGISCGTVSKHLKNLEREIYEE